MLSTGKNYPHFWSRFRAKARPTLPVEALAASEAALIASAASWVAHLKAPEALERVARASAASFTDWCFIHRIDEGGVHHRLARAHADAEQLAFVAEMRRRYPMDRQANKGLPQTLRTGEVQVLPPSTERSLLSETRDRGHFEMLRSLGLTTSIAVPLTIHGKNSGAMTFTTAAGCNHNTTSDVATAKVLADLISSALARADYELEARRLAADERCLLDSVTELERRLHIQIQARDEALANMSHELRTPLQAILGFSQLLQDDPRAGDAPRFLLKIRENGDRLLQLTDRVLRLFEVRAHRAKTAWCDLGGLLGRLENAFAARARGETRLQFAALVPARTMVYIDSDAVLEILGHLLDNAIKNTDSGCIQLDASLKAELLCFDLVDTGRGMSSERSAISFQPFVRDDSPYQRRADDPGAGLGLTLAKELAEQLGGGLAFVENARSCGAAFRLWVPVTVQTCQPLHWHE